MQKVKFTAKIDAPKIKKGQVVPGNVLQVPAGDVVTLSIKGLFTVQESGALEAILRSWHRGGVKEDFKKAK